MLVAQLPIFGKGCADRADGFLRLPLLFDRGIAVNASGFYLFEHLNQISMGILCLILVIQQPLPGEDDLTGFFLRDIQRLQNRFQQLGLLGVPDFISKRARRIILSLLAKGHLSQGHEVRNNTLFNPAPFHLIDLKIGLIDRNPQFRHFLAQQKRIQ